MEKIACSLAYKEHLIRIRPLLESGDIAAFRGELNRYWEISKKKPTVIFKHTPGFAKVGEMNDYVERTNPDSIQSEIDYFESQINAIALLKSRQEKIFKLALLKLKLALQSCDKKRFDELFECLAAVNVCEGFYNEY